MISLYDVVRLLESISKNPTDYTITHMFSRGIHRLRYTKVLCTFVCQLMNTLYDDHYDIVQKIYHGDYPSHEKDWYLVEGFLYIGDIDMSKSSILTSLDGIADVIYTDNNYSYSIHLWEGLSNEIILKLLKDRHPYVQKFGCQYFQYVLSTRIEYSIPSKKIIIYV